MNTKITFRSMDHSDAIEKDIHEKINKINKYFKREQEPVHIEVVVEAHREKHYFIVEFKIQSAHYHIVARSEGIDMYAMIDNAAHKMVKEITRKKEKLVDFRHRAHAGF